MRTVTESEPTLHIVARDLVVSYESVVALNGLSMDLKGGIIAIVGHNGAGKSTLIKAILGLLPIKSGTIGTTFYHGAKMTTLKANQHMAFCPETGAVFADISVESYIQFWCRIKQNDPYYYINQGESIVERLNLSPLFSRLGRELSKGQRRRVQTAIGFLTDPKLFLFDEPFDGLDVLRTNELAELIREKASTMTFIVSSHRMDVMEQLADSAVVLREGSIIASGDVPTVSTALAESSYAMSGVSDLHKAVQITRSAFPNLTISPIGTQLVVTGAGVTPEVLEAVMVKNGESNIALTRLTPSLGDAMNYHLMEMRQAGKH